MLKLLAAPLAGAAALLVCALAMGIDPLVSAIVGALVWGGVQLIWGASSAMPAPGPAQPLSPGQARQIEAARTRITRLSDLAEGLQAVSVARWLKAIAGRSEAMIARLHAEPGQFELTRKALGNYLAQALALAERLREAEAAGRTDDAMVSRLGATFERLDTLFAAVEDRGAALDRIDLDARIAVLEAEIDADLALRND